MDSKEIFDDITAAEAEGSISAQDASDLKAFLVEEDAFIVAYADKMKAHGLYFDDDIAKAILSWRLIGNFGAKVSPIESIEVYRDKTFTKQGLIDSAPTKEDEKDAEVPIDPVDPVDPVEPAAPEEPPVAEASSSQMSETQELFLVEEPSPQEPQPEEPVAAEPTPEPEAPPPAEAEPEDDSESSNVIMWTAAAAAIAAAAAVAAAVVSELLQ